MEFQCAICGSKFATKQCYFCQSKICTSCIVPEDVTGNYTTTKCITCDRRKINKISIVSVLKRNKFILGILVGFWIYKVFPLPFLQLFGMSRSNIISAYSYYNRCHDHSIPFHVFCVAEKIAENQSIYDQSIASIYQIIYKNRTSCCFFFPKDVKEIRFLTSYINYTFK